VEAEIADIAKALSLQSGVNIACSANTKGKITLRQRNITLDEALQLVSRLAGLDYRKVGDTFIIGNPEELRSILARAGVTEIWVPQNLSLAEAKELVQTAAPFVTVTAQEQSKRIVLLGTPQDVAAARTFLTQVDASTAAPRAVVPPQFVTRMCTLKYLNPTSACSILTGGAKGGAAAPAGDAKAGGQAAGGNLFPTVDVRVAPEPSAPPAAAFKPLSTDSKAIQSQAAGTSSGGADAAGGI